MPTLPAANASLIGAPLEVGVLAHRLVGPPHVVQHLQTLGGGVVVDRGLGAVLGLHPAAERVGQGGEHPAAGVVGRHLDVARLAGPVRDRLGVLTDLVPRGRRGVRVESGLLEQGAVVVEADAVHVGRQAVDLAVGALRGLQDARVELGAVRQGLDVLGDVGDLLALGEALGVGERHPERGRQRATGELRREGLGAPLPLDGLHDDVGVLLHEGLGLRLDRVDGALLVAGPPALDRDGHLAAVLAVVVVTTARRDEQGEGGDGRQRAHAAPSVDPHDYSLWDEFCSGRSRGRNTGLSVGGARRWHRQAGGLLPGGRWRARSGPTPAGRSDRPRGW